MYQQTESVPYNNSSIIVGYDIVENRTAKQTRSANSLHEKSCFTSRHALAAVSPLGPPPTIATFMSCAADLLCGRFHIMLTSLVRD